MIVWWGMFLKGNGAQFRVTLAGMPKKCYPTSVEGLIRMEVEGKSNLAFQVHQNFVVVLDPGALRRSGEERFVF